MAERLATFPVSVNAGGRTGHPWDDWLDGTVWRLERGTDFHGSPLNFCGTAWKQAKARGLKLRTHRAGDVVVIQTYETIERRRT